MLHIYCTYYLFVMSAAGQSCTAHVFAWWCHFGRIRLLNSDHPNYFFAHAQILLNWGCITEYVWGGKNGVIQNVFL